MLRDAPSRRKIYMPVGSDKLPVPIYLGHPVASDPTGDPAYIDGQVADILVELQEKPIRPFVEGEPIGTLDAVAGYPDTVMGVPQGDWNRMVARVWLAHRKLTRAARRKPYTTDRSCFGKRFRCQWQPERLAFSIKELA